MNGYFLFWLGGALFGVLTSAILFFISNRNYATENAYLKQKLKDCDKKIAVQDRQMNTILGYIDSKTLSK